MLKSMLNYFFSNPASVQPSLSFLDLPEDVIDEIVNQSVLSSRLPLALTSPKFSKYFSKKRISYSNHLEASVESIELGFENVFRFFVEEIRVPVKWVHGAAAALNGEIKILRFIHDNYNIEIDERIIQCGARSGNPDLLRYFIDEHHLAISNDALTNLGYSGNASTIRSLQEKYNILDLKRSSFAFRATWNISMGAMTSGNFNLVEFLSGLDPMLVPTFSFFESDPIASFDYVYKINMEKNSNFHLDKELDKLACYPYFGAILSHLDASGIPLDVEDAVLTCCDINDIDSLKYLSSKYQIFNAVQHVDLKRMIRLRFYDIVEYLLDHRVSIDEETYHYCESTGCRPIIELIKNRMDYDFDQWDGELEEADRAWNRLVLKFGFSLKPIDLIQRAIEDGTPLETILQILDAYPITPTLTFECAKAALDRFESQDFEDLLSAFRSDSPLNWKLLVDLAILAEKNNKPSLVEVLRLMIKRSQTFYVASNK